jgi:hypothetical protein
VDGGIPLADGGIPFDGGLAFDGGVVEVDGGVVEVDGGAEDGGAVDGGAGDGGAVDGGVVDGGSVDGGAGDGGVACAPALNPTAPDGGTVPGLVISEIKPGEYIEVFNPGAEPIDFSMAMQNPHQFCSPFNYEPLSTLSDPGGGGTAVTVPAGGYAAFGWPLSFTRDMDSGGEVILYANGLNFDNGANILDFVCWGTYATTGGTNGTRKALAESVGKWSGNCAAAIDSADNALHRKIGTTGTSAADYEVGPKSPMTCAP